MQNAETVLDVLRGRGRRGLPIEGIYRQLFNPQLYLRLSSRFGGDSAVGEGDLDAGAAEVDHCDQRVGGVESVCAV